MGLPVSARGRTIDRRAMVELIVRAHQLAGEHLARDLIVAPAWDMLLDLYASDHRRPVSLTSLCGATSVPERSALRTIDAMVKKGWVTRLPDPHDRRRTNIRLAPRAVRMMDDYFDALAAAIPEMSQHPE